MLRVVLVVSVILFGLGGSSRPAGAVVPVWIRPVAGPVVGAFIAPAHTYGPGHRGVDLAAPPDSVVRAAGAGMVSFAGPVAGGLHVVVTHPNGLRTGYSFLAAVAVTAGEAVDAGAVLGRSGGIDPDSGHDGSVLHFSLRRGSTYLDPMVLFAPVDLAAVVRLAPLPPGYR